MDSVLARGGPPPLDDPELLSLLGNERRYACLRYLQEHAEEPVPVKELASTLATELADDPPASEDFENSIYVSLCQTHLPKLADADLIEYDPESKSVRRGNSFGLFQHVAQAGERVDARPICLTASLLTAALLLWTLASPGSLARYVTPALLVVHTGLLIYTGVSYR